MNIQDVAQDQIKTPKSDTDLVREMILHQQDLLERYKEIEGLPDWPMPFQDRQTQRWVKDYLWRVTEEISEGMEALYLIDTTGEIRLMHQHITHFFEEIADAIHFMLCVMIITDVQIRPDSSRPDVLVGSYERARPYEADCKLLGEAFFCIRNTQFFDKEGEIELRLGKKVTQKALALEVICILDICSQIQYQLGLCGNVLKNKLWKQTAVMSDQLAFNSRVRITFQWMFRMLFRCGFTPKDIFMLYMSKKLVNKWRQETQY